VSFSSASRLCAGTRWTLYSPARCLEATERLIRTGELRPRVLLRAVRTRWVSFAELSDLDGSQHFFDNVNTPADFERARQRQPT
jgi:molybdopterin-guanine dinucleotide biosynthesis protein A